MNILLRLLIFLLFLVITFLLLFLQLARLVLCFNAFLTLKKHMRDYCGQAEHKKSNPVKYSTHLLRQSWRLGSLRPPIAIEAIFLLVLVFCAAVVALAADL